MTEDEASTQWWTQVLAGSGGDLSSTTATEEYLVLPKPSSPRVVVDRQEERAVRDVMDRMISSRTSNGAVRSLVGGASVLMTKKKGAWNVSAGQAGKTLRQHLSNVLDTELRISVSVGPPRPNRKPVIRCYRESGLFAVAKLGLEDHTATMVTNEARWLEIMAGQPLTNVQTAPVLYAGDYDGHPLLVMSALDLESDLGLDFADVPLKIAGEFASRYSTDDSVGDSEWWQGLASRMTTPQLDSVHAQLSQLEQAPEFSAVEASAWHGDWSPWNMGVCTSGKLCIWDWERATIGVPHGFDICHLHFQYGEGLDHADDDLTAMGVPSELHNITKQMYLYELCARHSEAQALGTERHATVMTTLEELSAK